MIQCDRVYQIKTPVIFCQFSTDRILLENAYLVIRDGPFPEHETARLGLVGRTLANAWREQCWCLELVVVEPPLEEIASLVREVV